MVVAETPVPPSVETMHCPVQLLTLVRTARVVMIIHSIVHLLVVLAWYIAAALILTYDCCTHRHMCIIDSLPWSLARNVCLLLHGNERLWKRIYASQRP